MVMSPYDRALAFAQKAHGNQKRRYTGEPYWTHLIEVAELVAATPGATEAMVATALLHDVVEDTDVTLDEIRDTFGPTIAYYVQLLTDPPLAYGNRAKRKAHVIEKMRVAPAAVKTIKLADMLANTSTIDKHDPDFAKVYLEEKRALLPSLKGGDEALHRLVAQTLGERSDGVQEKVQSGGEQ